MTEDLEGKFRKTLADSGLQAAVYTGTGLLMQKRWAVVNPDVLPEYQELRDHARALKEHALANLDHYLEQFEAKVRARGGKVVWCRGGDDVASFFGGLAREKNARLLVKSKSMTTEEIGLNERLERHGLEVVETDLGEFIVQLAKARPYHIVVPAMNMTRYDISDLFQRTLGVGPETVPENQTQIARGVLREKFLAADIGVSGANFLVADSGAVGSAIGPLYRGLDRDPWLPFASSLCGACAEVCPVKIDLPKLLLELRSDLQCRQGLHGLELHPAAAAQLAVHFSELPAISGRPGTRGRRSWIPREPPCSFRN